MLPRRIRIRLVDLFRNTDSLTLYQEYLKTQWLSTDMIYEKQWERVKNLLKHAYHNVPYYQKTLKINKLEPEDIKSFKDFRQIPIITKDIIRANWRDMQAKNMKSFGHNNRATGGSTGTPLSFYVDRKSRSAHWANIYRQWTIAGWNIGDRLVYLGGASLFPTITAFKKWFYIKLNNWLLLSAFDMSQDNMKKWVKKIRRFKPRFMHSYASSAYLFAEFLEHEGIDDISFRSVITSAEPLYPHYRCKIEKVFSAEVFDLYGAVDGGGFAYECNAHKGLHYAHENSLMEILKDDDTPAGPGDSGKIVTTDLFNYAMPFIRYKVGDIATLSSSPCECGRSSRLLAKIKGRSHDFITARYGKKVHGEYFSHLFRNINWISQFYIVQKNEIEIIVNIRAGRTPSKDQIDWLLNILKKKFYGMKVDIDLVDAVPKASSEKFKFVINKTL